MGTMVSAHWKTSMNVGALVTLVAGVHYFYISKACMILLMTLVFSSRELSIDRILVSRDNWIFGFVFPIFPFSAVVTASISRGETSNTCDFTELTSSPVMLLSFDATIVTICNY